MICRDKVMKCEKISVYELSHIVSAVSGCYKQVLNEKAMTSCLKCNHESSRDELHLQILPL